MAKLVPVQIDSNTVLYIEAQEDAETPVPACQAPMETGEEQQLNRAKGLSDLKLPFQAPSPVQSMQLVQSTIRTYALYCLSAFKNFGAANVDEVTLEFGVNLSADAGVPYIASGKAQSNLKITVKCSYGKPEPTHGHVEG